MGASQSIKSWDSSAFVRTALRELICCLAVVAVAATIAGLVNLRAQGEVRIPPHAYMPPDFPASVSPVIPTPQYLPAGYELWTIKRPVADGFRIGKHEVEIQYRDPGCWARKIRCSLELFVSPMTDRPFFGTAAGAAESVSLGIGNRTVQAQYFKDVGTDLQPGMNPPSIQRLEAGNFNALVFPFDRFMIGIRGNKQGGVGRSELIKVAKSLTYTAR